MSKFLSRKFLVMLLTGAANLAVVFGAPEESKDLIPYVLTALDSVVAVYLYVQGLIDKVRAQNEK